MKKTLLFLSLFLPLPFSLKSAELTHSLPTKQPYQCPNRTCGKIINTNRRLLEHLIECLLEIPITLVETYLYYCPFCDEKYLWSKIINHCSTEHPERNIFEQTDLLSIRISPHTLLRISTIRPHASTTFFYQTEFFYPSGEPLYSLTPPNPFFTELSHTPPTCPPPAPQKPFFNITSLTF